MDWGGTPIGPGGGGVVPIGGTPSGLGSIRGPGAARPISEVSGIGAAYETRLGDAGISTLGELASSPPERVAEVLGMRDIGRAGRLVDEAARLAGEENGG